MEKRFLAMCLMFLVASSVIYEVQGTFLLKLYLARKIPRHCIAFSFFASKGMLMFVKALQGGCPATPDFKVFFEKFNSFITFINSVSPKSSSNVDAEIEGKATDLSKACSALGVSKSGKSSGVGDFKNTMVSMAKILIEQKKRGPKLMTFAQKRELVLSMVKWTQSIAQTVKSAAEKRGKSVDISSYGLDVDVNSSVKSDSSSDENKDSSVESGSTTSTNSGSATSSRTGTSSKKGSENTYSDTSGSSSPSGSPSTYVSDETSTKGSASGSGNVSTKKSGSSSGTTTKTGSENSGSVSKESEGGGTYTDTTGTTSASPSGSPSYSTSVSGETSSKGNTIATGTASSGGTDSSTNQESNNESKKSSTSGSSTTSVKQVETETSQEIISFITNLEKKYAEKSELKGFFEKLKTSMATTAKISTSNAQDLFSTMRSAAGKIAEAMAFVSSRFSKTEEKKTNMETCQEQVMQSLKELQDVKSKLANSKTVTSTQKTEIKKTITRWEQVTTQFVETAASSSSSSSSSSLSSSNQSSG